MAWRPALLFFLVCLLSGSSWLLPAEDSSITGELCSFALSATGAAVLLGGLALLREGPAGLQLDRSWAFVADSAGAIALPTLLILLGNEQFTGLMAVATEASVPVVVAVALGNGDREDSVPSRLLPSLTALAGTLLVLPVALPESVRGWIGLALYVLAACLAGICGVRCHRAFERRELRAAKPFTIAISTAAVAGAGAGFALLDRGGVAEYAVRFNSSVAMHAMVNAMAMAGVMLLLNSLAPLALAARFVVTPLIAAVEAVLLMRPTISGRIAGGALLMLAGSLACFRSERSGPASGEVSLR